MLTLLLSVTIFAVPSNAEWIKVIKNEARNTFSVDFERILKKNEYMFLDFIRQAQCESSSISINSGIPPNGL